MAELLKVDIFGMLGHFFYKGGDSSNQLEN